MSRTTHLPEYNDLEILLTLTTRQIIRGDSLNEFLLWFLKYAPSLTPGLVQQTGTSDPEAQRALLLMLGRAIWSRTPVPANRFRPRSLPKPERNAPCPCGSGIKYKQCCSNFENAPSPLDHISFLPMVLDQLTAKERKELPYAQLNHEELAHVAREWLAADRAKDAIALLEGLFRDMDTLDERAETAFNCLLDCYDRCHNPLKKKRLLERGFKAPNKHLRAAAMQRQCCILADRREYDAGWALFQQLQRLTPNDPSLAHLEILMLNGQGKRTLATDRARFWLARLSHHKATPVAEELLDFLRQVADGRMGDAMAHIAREMDPVIDHLIDIVQNLPKPAVHYTLTPHDGSAGPLVPDTELRKLLETWEDLEMASPTLEEDLHWLTHNPVALQSFDILESWLDGLAELPELHGSEEAVFLPLLQHAEAILRLVITRYKAETCQLEWGWHENRPALRLMERLATQYRVLGRTKDAVTLMTWMVHTLNPHDNQGMRFLLIHDLLRLNRPTDAIALGNQYPDDFSAMRYGHALAFYLNKDTGAALSALHNACNRYPEVRKMLIADNPRKPRINEGYITVGGKDEAWVYRQEQWDLWQSSGGLAWLKAMRI